MSYNPNSLADRQELAKQLDKMFVSAGFFKQISLNDTFEDVYEFSVTQMPGARIVVYSSIFNGAARSNGTDAIRIVILWRRKDGTDFPLLSETRINRTGQVNKIVDRTLSRMRDAFATLRTRERNKMRCTKCGAPLFTSSKGNQVCVEICWEKR